MSNINQLSSAIKFALFVGAAATLGSVSAFAQEAATEAKEIDAVNVVGSKIRRIVEEEGAQPVQVLTRADIERTGLNNVYEILNTITSSDGSGLSTVTTQTNGSDGSQQVSLRGLGAQRTLVLVDGRRWVTDIDGTVDFSTIPLAIVQRIEVLKDGASAIYGSDAIAGVINIVTRRDYDGAQAGLYYGQTAKSDGARKGADITVGAKSERSNVVFSLSHTSQESIFAGDRELSNTPVVFCDEIYGLGACSSANSLYGRFSGVGIPGGSRSLIVGANLADGLQASDFSAATNPDSRNFNFAPINYLQQPAKRTNVFAAGSFDITDNLSAFVRASYTKRTSDQQLAPVPLTIANSGANGAAWQMSIAANSIFNPFGVPITSASYRMLVAGPRHNFFDYDIFGLQAGLEGNFTFADRAFNWELVAQRNDGQYDQRGENYTNLNNLRLALGPSFATAAGIFCGTLGAPLANCVPLGITAGPTAGVGLLVPRSDVPGTFYTITQADVDRAVAYVKYTLVDQTGITSLNYSGNISGELFELPGGMMAFAAGFETRSDDIFYQPDALVAGFGSSNNFSAPTKGRTTVDELYLEVIAPVLKDVTGFQELEFTAAIRKSDYTASGLVGGTTISSDPGSPTNMKFGMKWKPIDDLLVRFNWGETFRAPSANDLYSGQAESFPRTNDPCRSLASSTGAASPFFSNATIYANCVANGVNPGLGFTGGPGPGTGTFTGGGLQPTAQIRSQSGGNPLLTPEFGTNRTAGIVYSPSWLEGFNMSVDWWNIKLQDALASRSAGFVLNACYTGADPTFCSFITRNAAGDLALVRTTAFNLDSLEVTGVDLGLGYNFSTRFGDFRTKLDTTYIQENLANGNDSVGNYDGTPNWEYRSTLNVTWTKGDWDASWTTRYMSDIAETCFTACNQRDGDGLNHSGQYAVHDIQFGWKAPWDAKVSIGARNVFGKEPPILANNSFAHSFDAAYDIPGGAYWYAQYRQDF